MASTGYSQGSGGAQGMLTAERLRAVLAYDPDTGQFTRLIDANNRCPSGSKVGTSGTNGYVLISVDNCRYKAHRLAWLWMTGAWPEADVDHINGLTSDNRWVNLRAATRSQNGANSRKSRNKTIGYKGVYWLPREGKWMAQISPFGRRITIGRFDTAEEARDAYLDKAREFWGEFARAA